MDTLVSIDDIHRYRGQKDSMYKIIYNAFFPDFIDNVLKRTHDFLFEKYGENLERLGLQSHANKIDATPFIPVIKKMCDPESNINMKTTAWLFFLYIFEEIQKDYVTREKIHNRTGYETWFKFQLAPACQRFLNGEYPNTCKKFAREMRNEYVRLCGYPIPTYNQFAAIEAGSNQGRFITNS